MNNFITIVTGLPRSGTSMMMRMLKGGGMEVVFDNIRKADEDNPYGYFEFEEVKRIKENFSWIEATKGKAFKMVSMLLYELPPEHQYKVIFMKRNIDEVIASQRIMLKRQGRVRNGSDDAEVLRLSEKHLVKVENWLKRQKNIETLIADYNDIIERPLENAKIVNKFLTNGLDIDKMITAVDKTLYRNRISTG